MKYIIESIWKYTYVPKRHPDFNKKTGRMARYAKNVESFDYTGIPFRGYRDPRTGEIYLNVIIKDKGKGGAKTDKSEWAAFLKHLQEKRNSINDNIYNLIAKTKGSYPAGIMELMQRIKASKEPVEEDEGIAPLLFSFGNSDLALRELNQIFDIYKAINNKKNLDVSSFYDFLSLLDVAGEILANPTKRKATIPVRTFRRRSIKGSSKI